MAYLPSGWRLNGAGRYLLWDIAPDAGPVTYDNFSVRPVPVSALLIAPTNGAQNVGMGPTLKASVANQNTGAVSITYFVHEPGKPFPGRDFLIPVLPDTQNYGARAGIQRWAMR